MANTKQTDTAEILQLQQRICVVKYKDGTVKPLFLGYASLFDMAISILACDARAQELMKEEVPKGNNFNKNIHEALSPLMPKVRKLFAFMQKHENSYFAWTFMNRPKILSDNTDPVMTKPIAIVYVQILLDAFGTQLYTYVLPNINIHDPSTLPSKALCSDKNRNPRSDDDLTKFAALLLAILPDDISEIRDQIFGHIETHRIEREKVKEQRYSQKQNADHDVEEGMESENKPKKKKNFGRLVSNFSFTPRQSAPTITLTKEEREAALQKTVTAGVSFARALVPNPPPITTAPVDSDLIDESDDEIDFTYGDDSVDSDVESDDEWKTVIGNKIVEATIIVHTPSGDVKRKVRGKYVGDIFHEIPNDATDLPVNKQGTNPKDKEARRAARKERKALKKAEKAEKMQATVWADC